jgi:hypothetical protein
MLIGASPIAPSLGDPAPPVPPLHAIASPIEAISRRTTAIMSLSIVVRIAETSAAWFSSSFGLSVFHPEGGLQGHAAANNERWLFNREVNSDMTKTRAPGTFMIVPLDGTFGYGRVR